MNIYYFHISYLPLRMKEEQYSEVLEYIRVGYSNVSRKNASSAPVHRPAWTHDPIFSNNYYVCVSLS